LDTDDACVKLLIELVEMFVTSPALPESVFEEWERGAVQFSGGVQFAPLQLVHQGGRGQNTTKV
jgi:hypothetical protein